MHRNTQNQNPGDCYISTDNKSLSEKVNIGVSTGTCTILACAVFLSNENPKAYNGYISELFINFYLEATVIFVIWS